MEYQIVSREPIPMIGIELRTSNSVGKAMLDIPKHWEKFYRENMLTKIPNRKSDDVIATYIDYESDHSGAYSLIIGCEVNETEDVPEGMITKTIPEASFAMMTAKGPLPISMINAWREIWSSDLKRTYSGDFELYGSRFRECSPPEIDIFVAIES